MKDMVNHPPHYSSPFKTRQLECIDITRHLNFSLGNAVKYIWRAGEKGSKAKALEDLDKAEWYLDDVGPRVAIPDIAVDLFELLEADSSPRYWALRYLICDLDPDTARTRINEMRKAFSK